MASLIKGLEERFLGWMTGFEFLLTPPIIKQIKQLRMQRSENRGGFTQLRNRDATMGKIPGHVRQAAPSTEDSHD